jgi:hypothetical protein
MKKKNRKRNRRYKMSIWISQILRIAGKTQIQRDKDENEGKKLKKKKNYPQKWAFRPWTGLVFFLKIASGIWANYLMEKGR